MKALVWHGGHRFEVEQVADPRPEAGEIVVKVEAAAICGSDFHMDDFGAAPPLWSWGMKSPGRGGRTSGPGLRGNRAFEEASFPGTGVFQRNPKQGPTRVQTGPR